MGLMPVIDLSRLGWKLPDAKSTNASLRSVMSAPFVSKLYVPPFDQFVSALKAATDAHDFAF